MSQSGSQTGNVRPVDISLSGDFTLDGPVDAVWPIVLDYTSWQSYPIAEHVSGPVGEPGEVVRLLKVAEAFETPPYFARTVALEPGRRVVWKVYPEPSAGNGDFLGAVDFSGYVDFQLDADGPDRTRFSYNNFYEYVVAYEDESELAEFQRKMTADSQAMLDEMWERLRGLVSDG